MGKRRGHPREEGVLGGGSIDQALSGHANEREDTRTRVRTTARACTQLRATVGGGGQRKHHGVRGMPVEEMEQTVFSTSLQERFGHVCPRDAFRRWTRRTACPYKRAQFSPNCFRTCPSFSFVPTSTRHRASSRRNLPQYPLQPNLKGVTTRRAKATLLQRIGNGGSPLRSDTKTSNAHNRKTSPSQPSLFTHPIHRPDHLRDLRRQDRRHGKRARHRRHRRRRHFPSRDHLKSDASLRVQAHRAQQRRVQADLVPVPAAAATAAAGGRNPCPPRGRGPDGRQHPVSKVHALADQDALQ